MALESGGAAAAKRPRPPAEDGETGQHDHLSALPEPLQLRILTFVPLRSAIVASSLSRAWRGLWARRWEDDGNPSSSLHHHLRPYCTPSCNKLLESLELRQSQGRRGRIDRYSLVVDILSMRSRVFGRYLAAAAGCGVEDLRVELRTRPDTPLLFPFPAGPALARLSLRGIWVSGLHSRTARPCAALEAVLLHSVRLDDRDLARMLALCPRLRVLGLHSCPGIGRVAVTAAMGLTSLRSVTIVDCSCLTAVDFAVVSSLRSFRYSGGIFSSFCLPADALFTDLDIRFGVQKSRNVLICQKVFSDWFESRVCSKLATLTICSNVLFVVSSLLNATSHAESTKMGGDLFQSMMELQLLMLEMKAPELANIYVFLKKAGCSNLERLFVQLPITPREPLVDSFDYVGLEPPLDFLENLKVVKITNFSWNRYELRLVFFLLRKAISLHKLVLITSSLEPLHVPGIQQADLLFLAEAVANGKVILSGSDDAATQPFHSDLSADFKTFSC